MSLYAELKRRNVFRVAAAYLVVGWLLLQVSDVVLGFIGAPDWVGKAIIALLLLGLVPSLAIAWIFEVGPSGIQRDDGVPTPDSGTRARRLDYITLLALVIVAHMVMFEQLRVPKPESATEKARAEAAAAQDGTGLGGGGSGTADAPAEPERDATDADAAPVPRASVAVLPFANMSPDPENEYFADGIAEELLNVLSGIEGLKVASRTSAFSFKGKQTAVGEIARSLKVAHVLEGSVRKQGSRVRITAQLIDADTDKHLWSDTYDRELTDIFAVQEEIAQAISAALGGALGVGAPARPQVSQPTSDLQAYELYLRGRQLFYQRGDALRGALKLLEQAVERDPAFAEAWAVLSAALFVSPGYVGTAREETYAAAREAAQRAVSLDDALALPYAVLSQIAIEDGQLLETERLLDEALARDPRDSTAWLWRGMHFLAVGNFEMAERDLRKAVEIDPLSGVAHGWLATVLGLRGDRAAREEELARASSLAWTQTTWMRGQFALSDGDRQAAAEYLRSYFGEFRDLPASTLAVLDAVYVVAEDPSHGPELLAAVRADLAGFNGASWSPTLATLGMHREAIAVAMDPDLPPGAGYLHRSLWFPSARKILGEPEFLPLAQRDGLLPYWNVKGFPTGCQVVEGPPRRLDCTERWK